MADAPRDERLWEVGWDGHAKAQQRRMASLSLIEKIRWLEEAQAMVEHMKRSRRNRIRGTPDLRHPLLPRPPHRERDSGVLDVDEQRAAVG